MKPWLTVIGIGEDGLEGLSQDTQKLIENADVIVGGDRHLKKIPECRAAKVKWGKNFLETIKKHGEQKSKKLVVLASGDPMEFGVGSTLLKAYGPSELLVIPHLSAFSLAASRMRWSLPDVKRITLHGRPIDVLNYFLYPSEKILILSWNGMTPRKVAGYLTSVGFGDSKMDVFENMGGGLERHIKGNAKNWTGEKISNLNTIALECKAKPDVAFLPRVPGLPEEAFEHDGKITKKEIRAATLAALSPLPGQMLWDIGAGSGAVAIEWLRAEPSSDAIAFEKSIGKCRMIKRNAKKLGVPRLKVLHCIAPTNFSKIARAPDAVFLGGSVSDYNLLKFSWECLKISGRFVANAVTVEAQKSLIELRAEVGGDLTHMSIARSDSIGQFTALRPMMDVLQLKVKKI